jgi:hypothetical protein
MRHKLRAAAHGMSPLQCGRFVVAAEWVGLLSSRDARPYASIRRWARQFYDLEPGESVAVEA